MEHLSLIITFTVAATLLAMTPGLDTAVVMRTFSAEGKGESFRAAAGISAGCLIWGIAVALGLGAVIAASQLAYDVIRFCGVAYLCWLGVNLILRPRSGLTADQTQIPVKANWFWKGFISNLLNPKVGIFYVSFLPQFIPSGANFMGWTLSLVAIHIAVTMLWFSLLIILMGPLSALLRKPSVIHALDRLTGLVFIGFAAKLFFSKR